MAASVRGSGVFQQIGADVCLVEVLRGCFVRGSSGARYNEVTGKRRRMVQDQEVILEPTTRGAEAALRIPARQAWTRQTEVS